MGIEATRPGVGQVPERRVPGWRDGRRRGGFAEMGKDRAHGRGIGEESDDAHLGATHGAHEREHFVPQGFPSVIDAGEQQRPGVAGSAPMGRFGGVLRDGCGRRGGRPRREGGDRSAQGRVGGEDAEIAMAVKARRRHQGGEAVEQLERGQELRAPAAGARFRVVGEEVLAVELAQPVQGERWPGAVTQQTLASGTVSSLDAHRDKN